MLKEIDLNKVFVIENKDHLRHIKFLFEDSDHGFFKRNGLWTLLPGQKKLMSKNDLAKLKLVEARLVNKEK